MAQWLLLQKELPLPEVCLWKVCLNEGQEG